MARTLDSCPLNRGVRLIGVSVKRGSTIEAKEQKDNHRLAWFQVRPLPAPADYICGEINQIEETHRLEHNVIFHLSILSYLIYYLLSLFSPQIFICNSFKCTQADHLRDVCVGSAEMQIKM